MTTYLCTAGTSAARAFGGGFNSAWVKKQGGVEPAAQTVLKSFSDASMDSEQDLQGRLSAEIHSLARMSLTVRDRVRLYASETLDGQTCAQAVTWYLEQVLPGLDVRWHVVKGLQVGDAKRFQKEGVIQFVQRMRSDIEQFQDCVLNPTGGFKALVPYTTLIGMLDRKPVRYIYEHSNQVLSLPPFPVDLARDTILATQPVLERIEAETAIPRQEWEKLVPYRDREILETLTEVEGGEVTLSAVGLLVLDVLRRPSSLRPYLSRCAVDDIRRLQQVAGCEPLERLKRAANSREHLDDLKHGHAGGNLRWLKPGNTSDRYLVSEECGMLLVWRAVLHDEYEKLSADGNLGQRLEGQRREKYAPFLPMDWVE
ncbi:putative CRISPR-associated protein [Alkalilimnicola ehrlichii]|uniref:putative CRISPR-associated protein n=1 Tax=Alkalilimnicola ehrlichii TaxID=351052 RepID=UPI003BA2C064